MSDAPSQVRVRLKYEDLATFIDKFAGQMTSQGMFLQSRTPRPPGTKLRFELLLADGARAFAGEGMVAWVREPDPLAPARAGMAVRFTRLDAESQKTLLAIVAKRRERGLREDALPRPETATADLTERAPTGPEAGDASLPDGAEADALLERARKIARAITAGGVGDIESELAARKPRS